MVNFEISHMSHITRIHFFKSIYIYINEITDDFSEIPTFRFKYS